MSMKYTPKLVVLYALVCLFGTTSCEQGSRPDELLLNWNIGETKNYRYSVKVSSPDHPDSHGAASEQQVTVHVVEDLGDRYIIEVEMQQSKYQDHVDQLMRFAMASEVSELGWELAKPQLAIRKSDGKFSIANWEGYNASLDKLRLAVYSALDKTQEQLAAEQNGDDDMTPGLFRVIVPRVSLSLKALSSEEQVLRTILGEFAALTYATGTTLEKEAIVEDTNVSSGSIHLTYPIATKSIAKLGNSQEEDMCIVNYELTFDEAQFIANMNEQVLGWEPMEGERGAKHIRRALRNVVGVADRRSVIEHSRGTSVDISCKASVKMDVNTGWLQESTGTMLVQMIDPFGDTIHYSIATTIVENQQ